MEENCESKLFEDNDPLPEKLKEPIKKIIEKERYTDYKLVIKAIASDGGNYFGSLYAVDVIGKTRDGDKKSSIFVKGIVPELILSYLSVTRMFKLELFFYNELAVVFKQMQDEANVPVAERYNIAKTFEESTSEAIFFDNLAKKGYTTTYRMNTTSLQFAKLAIKQLGKLHGLSFALENKRSDYFDRKVKCLSCPFKFNEEYKGLLTNSSKKISECLDVDVRERFNAYLPKLWEQVQKYYCDKKFTRTLIHGDYKANNILTKEINGEIIDIIPVDYQLLQYGCPMVDFLYFIFLGTDQQFRTDHLENLKHLYYKSLAEMLNYLHVDVKSVFPREDFEHLYSQVLDYGLHCFINLMPFMFSAEDDVLQLDKDHLAEISIKTDPRMKERARGVVADFIRWGVL